MLITPQPHEEFATYTRRPLWSARIEAGRLCEAIYPADLAHDFTTVERFYHDLQLLPRVIDFAIIDFDPALEVMEHDQPPHTPPLHEYIDDLATAGDPWYPHCRSLDYYARLQHDRGC